MEKVEKAEEKNGEKKIATTSKENDLPKNG